jgi:hypothetical protein
VVKKGTRLTINVEGQIDAVLPLSEANLRASVQDVLSHASFTVNSLSITPRSSVWVGILDWPYSAEVQITTTIDYASANDPGSIVANAFYQAGGSLPTYTVQGYGGTQKPGVNPSPSTGPGLGTGLFMFGILAIAVAIFTWKNT